MILGKLKQAEEQPYLTLKYTGVFNLSFQVLMLFLDN